MDAIKLLKQDHDVVETLFTQFEAAGDRALKTKARLAQKICAELQTHAVIEEKVFYPGVMRLDAAIGKLVRESLEEHAIVKRLVAEIGATEAGDDRIEAKVTVLMELVRHHVKEEETDLFPMVRKALPRDGIVALGEKMETMKQRVKTELRARPIEEVERLSLH